MGKISKIFNFDNIGGKIKSLAQWSCWITILLIWIAAPIAFFIFMEEEPELCAIPVLSAVFAPFVIWIGSWTMYAFGEFVEDIHAMRTKQGPVEQKVKTIAKVKVKKTLTPANPEKLVKTFSILSGIFFILCGLTYLSWYSYYREVGAYFLNGIPVAVKGVAFIVLSIFIFKRSKKGVTILWPIIALIEFVCLFGYVYYSDALMLVNIVIYLCLMLLNIFQNKWLKNKIAQIAVFVLPLIGKIALSSEEFYRTSFVQRSINLTLIGIVFFLLYLVFANKEKKNITTDTEQSDL